MSEKDTEGYERVTRIDVICSIKLEIYKNRI